MKHKTGVLCLLWGLLCSQLSAQSTISSVLESVAANNPALMAGRQSWESMKLEYMTGLTLPNPMVQGQFLWGSPATAGNQTDLFAVQPFDFPTTYRKRRELAKARGAVAAPALDAQRREVLLETKLVCLELVFRNKQAQFFSQRKAALEKLQSDFQARLDRGEGNLLDVNKSRLQLLEVKQQITENEVSLQQLQNQLTALNGGQAIAFQDTIYPEIPGIPSFDQLEDQIEATDPTLRRLGMEKQIAIRQLQLAKAWKLPNFEAGYHYQGILGQRFNGIHVGLSIPVWEQKNRVQHAEANIASADLGMQEHRIAHYYEIKELYDRQEKLRLSLIEYQQALSAAGNTRLLDKALAFGEINTITYFMELNFYQNAWQHLLRTEFELQAALASLMRHLL
jgi:cobalt-zinc-cadmium efflux system outer membrane protein